MQKLGTIRIERQPMPRSASQPQDDALQGNLFERLNRPQLGSCNRQRTGGRQPRPERRRTRCRCLRPAPNAAGPSGETSNEEPAVSATEPNGDEPAWAHHSLVDPLQLTPMLRHYVELKTAHPDRVLLYRLGDFFECFFETRSNSPGCWNSPSPARGWQGDRPGANGRHPAPCR